MEVLASEGQAGPFKLRQHADEGVSPVLADAEDE